ASLTSRSWKRMRSLATSCRGDCLVDPCSRSGSKNMFRRVVHRICIRNSRRREPPPAHKLVVMANTERLTHDDRRRNPEHESKKTFLRAGSRPGGLLHRPERLYRLQSM